MALGAALALPSAGAAAAAAKAAASGQRVLRYAFQIAETGFDPAQISDIYSRTVTAHIFEAFYTYDHLARPPKVVPAVAVALPEISADFRVWTVKILPGVYFADDPAFKGARRELVAEDFIYAYKRFADPATKSPVWATMEDNRFIGLNALRKRALHSKQPFDYDQPIEGMRALDRYTVQFKLEEPRPRFIETLAAMDLTGAVAREVVQFYGDRISEHPVGTGAFKLGAWRRSSLIVLERNPGYREKLWHAEPAPDDAEGRAIAARLEGRRLPLIDRVEISVIEEVQPRWLSFLNGQANFLERLPAQFVNVAMPGGKTAPNLVKQGLRGQRVLTTDVVMTYFNMEDPVIGGYTPEKVALRRAMSLAVDLEREIMVARRGMGIPAQSPVIPFTSGYDPKFKSENSEYNPARAKALLDIYGYVDKDGDGWREMPDGSPLVLHAATQPDQNSRELNALWQKNMNAVGIRIEFRPAKWPENLKAARAGKLQIWGVATSAAGGDGQSILERYYGPSAGQSNLARFKLPAFDAVFDKLSLLPDGPEREALFLQAKRLAVAYVPYKLHCHRYVVDMMTAQVQGYRRPAYWQEWWHMVDVEPVPPGRSA
ncbi:MAG: bicyclomycin resistance protein [Leptothrix sp. (in: Bacteria)]|nr:bicyclomycin resistance protein [Leptothrix sp. (in: b-proteobacteria)]